VLRAPEWWPDLYDWVIGCNDQRVAPASAVVRNPTGANMGFRRDEVMAVGGFSEHLGRTTDAPLGCEETELGIRLTRAHPSMRVVSVPDAVCFHRVPKERVTWRYFRRRCVAEGRSKAVVARLTSFGAATSSERHYTGRAVPVAIAKAMVTGHLRRAVAIAAGIALASCGFVPGLLKPIEDTEERRYAATTVTIADDDLA
jgi:glucosyl-dolichyl phosphate glucuronosyltransferase